MNPTLRWAVVTFTVPTLLIVVWIVFTEVSQSIYWPSPIDIVRAVPETWLQGRISGDVVPSIIRLVIGYLLAVVLGVTIGFFVGSSRRLRMYVEPVFELFRAIPPPVLIPIVMVFAGIGDTMKVLVIAFGCFWPIVINTIEGVRGIDEVQLDTARSYRVHSGHRVFKVVLPAASPKIVAGARQSLSIGIIMMVISEMFAASNGIGFNIIQFQRLFELREMWSGIILLGIIGIVANAVFKSSERHLLRWHAGMQAQEK